MDTRKFAALTITAAVVSVAALLAVFTHYRPPIESLPLDFGYLGFAFIFANGFLLSYIIVNKKVGVLDRLLLTVGLGFGLTFLIMILAGVLWQITLLNVIAIELVILAAFGMLAIRRGLKLPQLALEPKNVQIKKHNLLQGFLIAIIGVLAFAAVYNAVAYPPTEWDSMAYGVNYARIIFQNSRIPLIAGSSIGIEMSAPYPPGMQLSATFLYTFAGSANDFYYRILSPIFSLATMVVVYKFARELTENRTAAVVAVSALGLTPFFWQLFIQDTYLMALTFMLTMAGYFFYKAYSANSDPRNYEVLGTLFCGFAALTSYIGLLAFGVPLLYTLHKRAGFKRLAGYLGLGALVVSPWYLRNLVLLGNPFYPFLGGKYLDPLLHSSTSQSFQQYLQLPEFALLSTLCKIAAGLLVVGVVFFTLSKKRRDFPLTITLYGLLIGISLMAVYVAFSRYIIVALPTAAVFFGFAMKRAPENCMSPAELLLLPSKLDRTKTKLLNAMQYRRVYAFFIVLVVLTSAVMLPLGINSVKPSAFTEDGEILHNRMEYIPRVFDEGVVWNWINQQNLPADAKIATFDIKEYYLNKAIFSLDSNEAAPLYHMDNIEEAVQFLKDNGVKYFLSAPWASPTDARMPQAYGWCIITRYLGNLDYFPPVYYDGNGATVYNVGPLNTQDVYDAFKTQGEVEMNYTLLIPPFKHQVVYLDMKKATNINETNVATCYIPIPVDYRKGNITITVNGNTTHLDIQLWKERVPKEELSLLFPAWNTTNYIQAISPVESTGNISTLSWQGYENKGIDVAGYFTIRVLDRSGNYVNYVNSTVPVDITFYNFHDLGIPIP